MRLLLVGFLFLLPIQTEQLRWTHSYATLRFDTLTGDLDPGRYAVFQGRPVFRPIASDPAREQFRTVRVGQTFDPTGYVVTTVIGTAYYSEFMDSGGTRYREPMTVARYQSLDKPAPTNPTKSILRVAALSAAVAVDAATSAQTTLASSITFAHTNNGNALGVGVAFGDTAVARTVSTITYAGTNLTLPASGTSYRSTAIRSELWYLAAPATGANNVVITMSGALDGDLIGGAVSFTGVDQASPVGTAANANGQSTTPSVDVTSAVDEMVMDSLADNVAGGGTPGAGQTERWDLAGSITTAGLGSTEAGAATVTMSWTVALADWGIVGLPFKAAATTTPARLTLLGVGP